MENFLKAFAEELIKRHAGSLGDVDVVLPNRRAGLYIGKYLAELNKNPFWSPNFITIEEFVFAKTQLNKASFSQLLFELFKSYKSFDENRDHDFNDFMKWGSILLNDINEVDSSLADPKSVFSYLSDAKRLQEWNVDTLDSNRISNTYLKFYANIFKYYSLFKENLLDLKIAYYAMASKILAETKNPIASNRPLYFVGFSSLTAAEKQIFARCKTESNAQFYWDIDSYYFEDEHQEAGTFLREYFGNTPKNEISWISNSLLEKPKEIESISIDGNVAQLKYVAELLLKLSTEIDNEPNECAIVLADESLAIPLLSSLPNCGLKYNFTMSYPLNLTLVFDFVQLLIDFANYSKQSKSDGNSVFYFRILEKIVVHPFFTSIQKSSNQQFTFIINEIKTSNKSYASIDYFVSKFENASSDILRSILLSFKKFYGGSRSLLPIIIEVIDSFYSRINELDQVLAVFVVESRKLLLELEQELHNYKIELNPSNFKKLIKLSFQNVGVPFNGEPLSGVQILGLLETRLLDFKKVIVVSANEGVLPIAENYQSFLPFDLRKTYNLPMAKNKTITTSYHFYRLLQRANHVYLLNNAISGSMGASEESSFTRQLQFEASKKNPNIQFSSKNLSIPLLDEKSLLPEIITYKKDAQVFERLREINEKGFSPSSIFMYIECSLKYYFSKIVAARELEELEETIESNTLGTVVHDCLEKLYENFWNQPLTIAHLNSIIKESKAQLHKSFKDVYKEGNVNSGINLLYFKLAEKFINRFLKAELDRINDEKSSIKIIALEANVEAEMVINEMKIKFAGKADRIEEVDGITNIWDFKTGTFDKKYISIKDSSFIKEKLLKPDGQKAFQLMMYAWMYQRSNAINNIKSGIIALKKQEVFNVLKINSQETLDSDILAIFEKFLGEIMLEIFDSSSDFKQTDELKSCANCSFSIICNRE